MTIVYHALCKTDIDCVLGRNLGSDTPVPGHCILNTLTVFFALRFTFI